MIKEKGVLFHNTIHNPHLPGWKLRGEKGRRGHFSLSVSTRTPHLPNFPRSGKGFSMIGLCSLAPSLLACIRVDADVVSWLIESTTTTTKEKNIVKSCEVSLLASTTDIIRIRPYIQRHNNQTENALHQHYPSCPNPYYIPSSRRNSRNSAPPLPPATIAHQLIVSRCSLQ